MAGYIGNAPVPQATQTRDNFTATAGQTSFATSGYTPGYLDVYLNGVRLDESDYTATNGSDVVLDTGAAVDDVVSVVAFQTFEVAGDEFTLTDITAQDSNGIQFNTDEGTERARIDASGNLLVGKTTSGVSGIGAELRGGTTGDYAVTATAASQAPMLANRTTSDGDLIRFRKDNTTVGSIGSVAGSYPYIGSDKAGYDTFLNFISNSSQSIRPSTSAGASLDNAITLGSSSARWKDLYLSGGVYLGGTGSANHLDDYEEGNYTPTIYGSTSGSVGTESGINTLGYTKVGRMVTVVGRIRLSGTNNMVGSPRMSLPFAQGSFSNQEDYGHGLVIPYGIDLSSGAVGLTAEFSPGQAYCIIMEYKDNASWNGNAAGMSSGDYIGFNLTYFTS